MSWIVWHPHQKLWNWRLVGLLGHLPAGDILVRALVWLDSVMLAVRVLARRVRRVGPKTAQLPSKLLYVDCGTHRDGLQVKAVSRWFGSRVQILAFEAGSEYCASAQANLADVPRLDLRQQALVGPDHEDPTARLYRAGVDGKGDSLFTERGTEFEEVPAVRLSQVLNDFYASHGEMPTVVRMNIEGAEMFVIEDLIASGMRSKVAGFYGMWDDLSKIDRGKDAEFRQLLRRTRVHTVTFNDRDLGHPLREWCIRYDIRTSLADPFSG